ncbi:hypothetical protein [Mariprofundus sp. KV]|uniref:hypothetical protein n=1 Tax=Mariprofundus sp. KV TaxID=2608715 RepID=UPI00159FDE5E|nr:hypothetical protein [Mariprofundus sp. KV]
MRTKKQRVDNRKDMQIQHKEIKPRKTGSESDEFDSWESWDSDDFSDITEHFSQSIDR